jgi:hypothetical protein
VYFRPSTIHELVGLPTDLAVHLQRHGVNRGVGDASDPVEAGQAKTGDEQGQQQPRRPASPACASLFGSRRPKRFVEEAAGRHREFPREAPRFREQREAAVRGPQEYDAAVVASEVHAAVAVADRQFVDFFVAGIRRNASHHTVGRQPKVRPTPPPRQLIAKDTAREGECVERHGWPIGGKGTIFRITPTWYCDAVGRVGDVAIRENCRVAIFKNWVRGVCPDGGCVGRVHGRESRGGCGG